MNGIIKQYQSIKAKYPDAILLFRVDDYYETFGEDAKVVSQHIGISLTHSTDKEVKGMAGFPFSALDSNLRKLVKAGYKVAICEQLEYPKRTKRDVKRGVPDFLKP